MLKKHQTSFSLFAMFFLLLATFFQPLSTLAIEEENEDEPVASGTVLIEHVEVDEADTVVRILDEKTITEPYGTPFQAEEQHFEGLALVDVPDNAQGEIAAAETTVTFKYKAISDEKAEAEEGDEDGTENDEKAETEEGDEDGTENDEKAETEEGDEGEPESDEHAADEVTEEDESKEENESDEPTPNESADEEASSPEEEKETEETNDEEAVEADADDKIAIDVSVTLLTQVEPDVFEQGVASVDGSIDEEVAFKKANHYTHTFKDLDKYDQDGNEINYAFQMTDTVTIDTPSGPVSYRLYAADGNPAEGFAFHYVELYEFMVCKQWIDKEEPLAWSGCSENKAGMKLMLDNQEPTERPSSVKVDIYQDEDIKETLTLSKANDWSLSRSFDLFNPNTQEKYEYFIQEHYVGGYISTTMLNENNHYIITNQSLDTPAVNLYIYKLWGVIEGTEKPDVRFKIFANNELINQVSLQRGGFVDNLYYPRYDGNGDEIQYTVQEVVNGDWDVEEELRVEEMGNGNVGLVFGFMNRQQKDETVKIPVEKIWKGTEGSSVTFTLFEDGKAIADASVTKDEDWKHVFELSKYETLCEYDPNIMMRMTRLMPEHDKNLVIAECSDDEISEHGFNTGNEVYREIDYGEIHLEEIEVEGYDTEITGDASTGFFVTNTEIEEEIPAEPEDPTTPEDPEAPVDPEDPTTPEEPEAPVDPEDPMTPEEPEEPGDPEDPTTPEEPEESGDPEDPMTPEEPEEPGDPEDPMTPEEPEDPGDPEDPMTPEEPEAPVDPEDPTTPEDPEESGDPEDPMTPEEPEESDESDDPTTPGKADKPGPRNGKLETTKESSSSKSMSKPGVFKVEVTPEGKVTPTVTGTDDGGENQLPRTSTNSYNSMVIGLVVILFGALLMLYLNRKRKID